MYESDAQSRKAILEILDTMDSALKARLEPLVKLPPDSLNSESSMNFKLVSLVRKFSMFGKDPRKALEDRVKGMFEGHTHHGDDQDLWILAFILHAKMEMVTKKIDELVQRMEYVENLAERLDEQ